MPVFTVRSVMTEKDWRKFVRIATFRRNPKVMLSIDAIALVVALFMSWQNGVLNLPRFMLCFVFFVLAAMFGVSRMVEMTNRQRMGKNAKMFGKETLFQFYDDKLGIRTPVMDRQHKLFYRNIEACLESRDFIILYLTHEEGLAICKRDIEDIEPLRAFLKEKFGKNYGKI